MTNEDFINLAKKKVADYFNNRQPDGDVKPVIGTSVVFVAWYAKVLENHKALLGTFITEDQHYYEATYNGDKKQLYLDVYDKQENKCFEVD